MPIIAPPPDRYELRGYRVDLDSLRRIWATLTPAPEQQLPKANSLAIRLRDGRVLADAALDELRREDIASFTMAGWTKTYTVLHVDVVKRTGYIQTYGTAPTAVLQHLQRLPVPRGWLLTRRNPYRVAFDHLSSSERKTHQRITAMTGVRWMVGTLAGMATVAGVVVAVILR